MTHRARLDGVLPRVFRHVPTRRAHFEHPFVPDLHGAGFHAPRFRDVPGARPRDGHGASMAGFAVVRGDRRRTLQRLAIRLCTGRTLEDHMTARHAAHVEPPILWPGYPEA